MAPPTSSVRASLISAFALIVGTSALVAPAQNYCASGGAFTAPSYWITNVAVNNLSHGSGGSATGYEDWTAFSATVAPNIPATVAVTVSNTFSTYSVRVFVDWNANGLFTDPGEAFPLSIVGSPVLPVATIRAISVVSACWPPARRRRRTGSQRWSEVVVGRRVRRSSRGPQAEAVVSENVGEGRHELKGILRDPGRSRVGRVILEAVSGHELRVRRHDRMAGEVQRVIEERDDGELWVVEQVIWKRMVAMHGVSRPSFFGTTASSRFGQRAPWPPWPGRTRRRDR